MAKLRRKLKATEMEEWLEDHPSKHRMVQLRFPSGEMRTVDRALFREAQEAARLEAKRMKRKLRR